MVAGLTDYVLYDACPCGIHHTGLYRTLGKYAILDALSGQAGRQLWLSAVVVAIEQAQWGDANQERK